MPDIVGQSRADRFRVLRSVRKSKCRHGRRCTILFVSQWPLARSVRSPMLERADGKFAGAVAVILDPEYLRDFYKSVQVGPNGMITVLHPEGLVMFRQPSGMTSPMGEVIKDHPLLFAANIFLLGLGPVFEAGGEHYLSAYRTLTNPPLILAVSASETSTIHGSKKIGSRLRSHSLLASLCLFPGD